MSVNNINCYEKARELGEMILCSEQAIVLSDTVALFKSNAEAASAIKAAENDYNAFVNRVMEILKSTITGAITSADSNDCGDGCKGCKSRGAGGCE